ncbi:MAG: Asp23/Gls24 family envelope stress response protein [Puniceicoccales bacterium]|jgi:uncharacterized alkaline shock family protein YloU|nr:Asp23/Gls24 family envelope stress response protein [Puniceicoccales bacterium]
MTRNDPDDKNNPTPTDEVGALGDIKINHSVVAGIVRLATMEVEGVHSVGGGFVEGLTEIFSKKESERGVRVMEMENGNYILEVKVVLLFGYELSKVGTQIQQNVVNQVQRMTMKTVDRVDVIIDGVRSKTHEPEEPSSVLE